MDYLNFSLDGILLSQGPPGILREKIATQALVMANRRITWLTQDGPHCLTQEGNYIPD